MGVNLGEVGFLNAIAPENAVEEVRDAVEESIERGQLQTREIPRLTAKGPDWNLSPALNEVVVQGRRRGHGDGLGIEVRIDGQLYAGGAADGVLVATPTGSTAYNLSEGGPLIHPSVDGLVVTEMCGEDVMPPLIVDQDSEVTIRIDDADTGIVVGDGSVRQDVTPPTEVRIEPADEPARIAGPSADFFTALEKLE
jgi:NAD+ kinase